MLQHQGQQPRSKPQTGRFGGIALIRSILHRVCCPPFPHELVETQRSGFSHFRATDFQESQIPFTEAPVSLLPGRHLFRNPHKWPVRLLRASCPFALCTRVYGSAERESKWDLPQPTRALLLLLGPAQPGPCCQGLHRKPTCPVCTVVW